MNMLAFYVAKGHSLESLANLSFIEKIFMHHAREQYYNERSELINAVLKAIGGEVNS